MPKVPPSPPVVAYPCYISISTSGYTLCSNSSPEIDLFNNAALSIQVTILVQDPNNLDANGKPKLINWVDPSGTPQLNPKVYAKSDLITNPNLSGSNIANTLSMRLPGKVKYWVKVKIIGDCCNKCPKCTTGSTSYYGKTVWSGEAMEKTYSVPLQGSYYDIIVFIEQDWSNPCEPNQDCQ